MSNSENAINDSQPLVSVIIPVYNGESFLDNCFRSVINQTYSNLEIIIVNDGSTDNSMFIISKYASEDARVCIVNKENEGVDLARKAGVKIAHGKYIQYLDNDDMLRERAIEYLVEKAESTFADIVIAPFLLCEDGKCEKSFFYNFSFLSGKEYLKSILKSRGYWCVWSKFHLRSLYENHIDRLEISFGEDIILLTQLLLYSKKVVSIDYPIVDYFYTTKSISHPVNFDDKRYSDFKEYVAWIDNYMIKQKLAEEFQEELAFFHLKNTLLRIYWGKYKDVRAEMARLAQSLKLFPVLTVELTRRERKIINVFSVSNYLGYLNLWRYRWQRKI